MGEETDNVITSVSKLQAKVKGLTGGFDILTETGDYKSTYDIIKGIGQVWEDMSDIDQAALLELLAGKNRSNALAAMLGNMEDLTKAYDMAMEAEGSAEAENQKYMDSIQGRIDQFTNATQTMWMNFISSDTVKWIVDAGTKIIQTIDDIGVGWSGLIALITGTTLKKYGKNILSFFDFKGNAKNIAKGFMSGFETIISPAVESLSQFEGEGLMSFLGGKVEVNSIKEIAGALREEIEAHGGVSKELAKQILLKRGVAEADIEGALAAMGYTSANTTLSFSFAGLGAAIKKTAVAFWASPFGKLAVIAAGIALVVHITNQLITTHEEYVDMLKESSKELQDVQSEIDSLNSELETTKERIDELNGKDKLTFAEGQELKRLQLQNQELERRLALQEALEKRKKKQVAEDFANAVNSDTTLSDKKVITYYDENGNQVSQSQATKQGGANVSASYGSLGLNDGYTQSTDKTQLEKDTEAYVQAKVAEEDALKALTDAQNDENAPQKDLDELQKNYEDAQKKTEELGKTLEGYMTSYSDYLNQEGVEWQFVEYDENGNAKELEQWQKDMNEYLQMVYDAQDKIAIVYGDDGAKENALDRIFNMTGTGSKEADKTLEKIKEMAEGGTDARAIFRQISNSPELLAYFNSLGISADEVASYLLNVAEVGKTAASSIDSLGKTISSYSDTVSKFQEGQNIANEAIYNGIELTDEQAEALQGLIGTEEDYYEAIDKTSGNIVKDASLLKKLIAQKKNEAAQNVKTEKTQARLQYLQLAKKIQNIVSANKQLTASQVNEINALYKEMGMVEKTIAKYSLLEQQLLGVADAFQEYEDAKSADEAKDYGSKTVDMLSSIITGLQTAKLGTEEFKTAVDAMIPEDVYSDLDTVEEKVAAIANYLKTSDFNDYFTFEFDDDGTLENVKMTLDNVKAFIEDGLKEYNSETGLGGVFIGEDWQHFDLSDDIKTLDDFCKAMGITKEMAFAMFTEIDAYDADWLNGDFSSVLDKLDLGIEGSYLRVQQEITDLNIALANGKINAKEYEEAMYGASEGEQSLADKAEEMPQKMREHALAYLEASKNVDFYKEAIEAANKTLEELQENPTVNEEAINNKLKEIEVYTSQLDIALQKKIELGQVTELELEVIFADIDAKKEELKQKIANDTYTIDVALDDYYKQNEEGEWVLKGKIEPSEELKQYVELLNTEQTLKLLTDTTTTEEDLADCVETLQDVQDRLDKINNSKLTLNTQPAITAITNLLNKIPESITITTKYKTLTENQTATPTYGAPSAYVEAARARRGNIMLNGTANAQGNWGAEKSETSLVGELGPEIRVRGNRWETIGENGAEFTDVKKGDIIFNHKQSEQLLKNRHINSRGKAYASGTAHASGVVIDSAYTTPTYYSGASSDNFWTSGWEDGTDAISDAADEFNEVFDAFEVLINKIDKHISLLTSKVESANNLNTKIEYYTQILSANTAKLNDLTQAQAMYKNKADALLNEVPSEYRDIAQRGNIGLYEFTGEDGEKALEAINNYREYADKFEDVLQQIEDTRNEISSTSVQMMQMIGTEYDNQSSLITAKNDRIQETIDLLQEEGKQVSSVFYDEMVKNATSQLDELKKKRASMQKAFNDAVEAGYIVRGTNAWYEALNAISEVDGQINECTKSIEEYQNAINDLHWENFDKMADAISNVSDELGNLCDIIDDEDAFDELGNWTEDGITKLGLLAQQMETAQYQTQMYADEIEQLEKDYAAGKYSASEYEEKLQDLKNSQWDSIKAYESSKDAIVALNKARIEAVKSGMQDEIDAYSELIEKQKESLQEQKDAHDWAKSVEDKQKEIDKIQRQLDAMAGDTSASAIAKRAQLQQQLYDAQQEMAEMYYDHDIETQQESLDRSLEDYQKEKDDEIEALEEKLKNEEQVIADSYALVEANTQTVANNLLAISEQYGISLSEAVTQPWQNGINALGEYDNALNTATSSFIGYLDNIKSKYVELEDQAKISAQAQIDAINNMAQATTSATYKAPVSTPSTNDTTTTKAASKPSVGATVTVKSSATNFSRDGGNGTRMASFVPGSSFTVYQTTDSEVLIGRNGAYTGWVYLKDIEGYAKGTSGIKKDQLAWIDENGLEELVLRADGNGKLSYLTKGSSVIPSDITENLMALGSDPTGWLERNRPTIGAPCITNNNFEISLDVAELIHIEHATSDSIPEIQDAVKKQLDAYMKQVNSSIRKYAR